MVACVVVRGRPEASAAMRRRQEQRGLVAPRPTGPGSGAVIPVTAPDGSQGFTYHFRLLDLPAPDRQFVAHVVQVEQQPCGFEVSFGQRKDGESPFERFATLAIRVSLEHREPVLASSAQVLLAMQKLLSERQMSAEEPRHFVRMPDHLVYLQSNIIGVAFMGLESVLDFHYLSPWEYQRLGLGEEPLLEQVVRIHLTTPACVGFLEALAAANRKATNGGV